MAWIRRGRTATPLTTQFLRAILAEDIAITATDGSLKSREDEIGDVRPSPGFTVDYFLSRDADVRMFGGQSAIVTGLLKWSIRDSDRATHSAPQAHRNVRSRRTVGLEDGCAAYSSFS